MNYLSTKEAASKWRISERTMIRYCEKNLVKGAFQVCGTWIIPDDAPRPEGAPKKEIKLRLATLARCRTAATVFLEHWQLCAMLR